MSSEPAPGSGSAPLAAPHAPLRAARWRVRLLGAVEASDGSQCIQRFPSRAVAALLARLAGAPQRTHPREELVDLLWPGVALGVGRNRLRQTLSTLKSLLEAPGTPGAAVLQADRLCVRVVPGALDCDATAFEALARRGALAEALALYGGEFMPGWYDEWIDAERNRLRALHERLVAAAPAPLPAPLALPPAPFPAAVPAAWALLPAYLTRAFGTGAAVAQLAERVRSSRLVTLQGAGGSGKTRLAVEVAGRLAEADGGPPFQRIHFVPLVSCGSADEMAETITRALGLPPEAAGGADRLAGALAGQRVLLVLDNFEQLVGRAEGLAAALLARLPGLHLLVTSRCALGLDGEQCVAAEPLPLPRPDAPLAEMAANPAVALFVDRARAARADFHLGAANHAAVAALVQALGGLPLAIELAATRVRSLPPATMLDMLCGGGAHLALLARSGPRGGHDPRHASMAQVIAWSWRLVDAPAQRLLGALTLFPGDAPVKALAAMLDTPPADTAATLDTLLAHALVRRTAVADAEAPPRFGLLEPVREFVAAQLGPAELACWRTRQRRWLLGWAGQTAAPSAGTAALEMGTVHAVLAAAGTDTQAAAEALQLALALRAHWDADVLPLRIVDALETAVQQLPPAAQALRGDSHELLAYLRFEAGSGAQARHHADAALALAGADPVRRARALVRRVWVQLAAGREVQAAGPGHADCAALLDEALALARGAGERELQARALHQQAVLVTQAQSDWVGGEALLAQSQALWQALGDRRKAYARLRNRAQCWLHLGRRDEAMACLAECERAAREDGDGVGQIDTLITLTSMWSAQRRWDDALQANRRCVALCWQRWHRHGLGYALWNAPRLLARLRRPDAAMRLMGFAAGYWTSNFGPLGDDDAADIRRVRRLVRAQRGAVRAQALELEGATMDLAAAVQLALQA